MRRVVWLGSFFLLSQPSGSAAQAADEAQIQAVEAFAPPFPGILLQGLTPRTEIVVDVTIGSSGDVIQANVEIPSRISGTSHEGIWIEHEDYAKNWRFTPSDSDNTRKSEIRFVYEIVDKDDATSREGAESVRRGGDGLQGIPGLIEQPAGGSSFHRISTAVSTSPATPVQNYAVSRERQHGRPYPNAWITSSAVHTVVRAASMLPKITRWASSVVAAQQSSGIMM